MDEIDKPFVVLREVLKRAERPPTNPVQARAWALPWYSVSARATARGEAQGWRMEAPQVKAIAQRM